FVPRSILISTSFFSPCLRVVDVKGVSSLKVSLLVSTTGFSSRGAFGAAARGVAGGVPGFAPGPPGGLLVSQPNKATSATPSKLAKNVLIGLFLSNEKPKPQVMDSPLVTYTSWGNGPR